MKAYKVELLIVDFDGLGEEGIKDTLENTNYPNHCFPIIDVMNIVGKDIGEWTDGHPFNIKDKDTEEYNRLFN